MCYTLKARLSEYIKNPVLDILNSYTIAVCLVPPYVYIYIYIYTYIDIYTYIYNYYTYRLVLIPHLIHNITVWNFFTNINSSLYEAFI